MARKQMIATGPLRYGTRMLSAGDGLSVNGPMARVLEALGKARSGRPLPQLDHDRDGFAGGSVTAGGEDIAALRAAYQAKFGKRPFNGWHADTLREKIAASS